MKKLSTKLFVVLVLLTGLISCGGDQSAENNQPGALETTEDSEQRDSEDLLDEDRYINEMIRKEVDISYRKQTGDYIDPRRVVELLKEPEAIPQPQQTVTERVSESWRISHQAHQEGQNLYNQGKLAEAIERWREMPTDKKAFTLSVEVDCSATIMRQTYKTLSDLEAPIFILEETVQDRNCYRICLGIFYSKEEAKGWIDRVRKLVPSAYPFPYLVKRP